MKLKVKFYFYVFLITAFMFILKNKYHGTIRLQLMHSSSQYTECIVSDTLDEYNKKKPTITSLFKDKFKFGTKIYFNKTVIKSNHIVKIYNFNNDEKNNRFLR